MAGKPMHVWMVQCMCPSRHCILANAGLAIDQADAEAVLELVLREVIHDMLTASVLNPRCGLCGAPIGTWSYETRRTRFATMEEAMPELRMLEANQEATAAIFGDMKRSD